MFQTDLRWLKSFTYSLIKIGYFHLKKSFNSEQLMEYRLCISVVWMHSHKLSGIIGESRNPLNV